MIPKYVVFNINKDAEVVASGNDLYELLSVYHGKAYEEPETVREARKMIERGY